MNKHIDLIQTEISRKITNWLDFNPFQNHYNYKIAYYQQGVSQGLARRILNYASRRMAENGLGELIKTFSVRVQGLEDEYAHKPHERNYCVYWRNDNGLEMGIQGIFISKKGGWPVLDHGIFIQEGQ